MTKTKDRMVKGLAATFLAASLSACGGGFDVPDLRGGGFNVDYTPTTPTDAFGDVAIDTDAAVAAAINGVLAAPAPVYQDVRQHPVLEMQRVAYYGNDPVGSIRIDQENLKLYFIDQQGSALQYPVAMGRIGAEMPDVDYYVDRTDDWPAWHPTEGMRERNPNLPARMEGGPDNPLGAAALYLSDENGYTLYRIHGNNDPSSIGTNASSGCVRMFNHEVTDLYNRVNNLMAQGVHIDVELIQPHEISVGYMSPSAPYASAGTPRMGG